MTKLYQAIILLGDSGSGKSTTWKTLRDVKSLLKESSEKQDAESTTIDVILNLYFFFSHFLSLKKLYV